MRYEMETSQSSAVFSEDYLNRFTLVRRWGKGPVKKRLVSICLNPSFADATINDPTVYGMMKRARAGGFDEYVMLNMFPFRSTDPAGLLTADLSGLADNDGTILRYCDYRMNPETFTLVVLGWGTGGAARKLVEKYHPHVLGLLDAVRCSPWCYAINQDGTPKHPLYVRHDAPLIPFPMVGPDGTSKYPLYMRHNAPGLE